MQVTLLHGYPDLVGKRALFCGYGNGPASYSQTTGDPVTVPQYQFYIDMITSGGVQTVSGTYYAQPRPKAGGVRQTWAMHWFVTSTNAEVANAVNLSAEVLQVAGMGGTY